MQQLKCALRIVHATYRQRRALIHFRLRRRLFVWLVRLLHFHSKQFTALQWSIFARRLILAYKARPPRGDVCVYFSLSVLRLPLSASALWRGCRLKLRGECCYDNTATACESFVLCVQQCVDEVEAAAWVPCQVLRKKEMSPCCAYSFFPLFLMKKAYIHAHSHARIKNFKLLRKFNIVASPAY